jgi:hypothetical protein
MRLGPHDMDPPLQGTSTGSAIQSRPVSPVAWISADWRERTSGGRGGVPTNRDSRTHFFVMLKTAGHSAIIARAGLRPSNHTAITPGPLVRVTEAIA